VNPRGIRVTWPASGAKEPNPSSEICLLPETNKRAGARSRPLAPARSPRHNGPALPPGNVPDLVQKKRKRPRLFCAPSSAPQKFGRRPPRKTPKTRPFFPFRRQKGPGASKVPPRPPIQCRKKCARPAKPTRKKRQIREKKKIWLGRPCRSNRPREAPMFAWRNVGLGKKGKWAAALFAPAGGSENPRQPNRGVKGKVAVESPRPGQKISSHCSKGAQPRVPPGPNKFPDAGPQREGFKPKNGGGALWQINSPNRARPGEWCKAIGTPLNAHKCFGPQLLGTVRRRWDLWVPAAKLAGGNPKFLPRQTNPTGRQDKPIYLRGAPPSSPPTLEGPGRLPCCWVQARWRRRQKPGVGPGPAGRCTSRLPTGGPGPLIGPGRRPAPGRAQAKNNPRPQASRKWARGADGRKKKNNVPPRQKQRGPGSAVQPFQKSPFVQRNVSLHQMANRRKTCDGLKKPFSLKINSAYVLLVSVIFVLSMCYFCVGVFVCR